MESFKPLTVLSYTMRTSSSPLGTEKKDVSDLTNPEVMYLLSLTTPSFSLI
jgi:hypothetical protein